MFDPPPILGQPGIGGTLAAGGDNPSRTGSVPRLVWYPFAKPRFYTSALKTISRDKFKLMKNTSNVRVRSKTVKPASGNGVWSIFSRER